jgi:subtilisin family serine protease
MAGLIILLAAIPASAADVAGASSFPATELIVRLGAAGDVPAVARDGLVAEPSSDAISGLTVLPYRNRVSAARALQRLRDDPRVSVVEPNVRRYLAWEPGDESYELQQWWLEEIHAPAGWNISTGTETVVVAVIDSGVSPTHPDLVGRLVPGYNAVDGGTDTADVDGHGTHVAGIIAAQGANGVGTAGVAMDVRIMPIRVVDSAGEIDVADEIEAIYWAVDNGADVINLSLGSDEYIQSERDAVTYAWQHGVVVVASAGNTVADLSYPANYDEAIAVGSLKSDGYPSSFTSRVTRVDIAAPGEWIYSPGWDEFYGDYWSDRFYSDYSPVTGTSFSTAIVSGAAALLKSVGPGFGVEDVRSMLKNTASDTGGIGPEAGAGAGRVNVESALRTAVYAAMHRSWVTVDGPVAAGLVSRTWLWGEGPIEGVYEKYDETQHGTRLVYYFDKSRMEVTNPHHDPADRWYVTNGLLVNELVSGQLQLGDERFQWVGPAAVNVAGDPDDVLGPTYSAFQSLLGSTPSTMNAPVLLTISRDGTLDADSELASYGVTAGPYIPETRHRVASVFWEYLNSAGPITTPEGLVEGQLFDPWFYATGYPITEPYWARIKVAEVVQDVLIQCFERRCLTYTPGNAVGWQVEMGNVGQHYYTWRYGGGTTADQATPNRTFQRVPRDRKR